MSLTAIKLVKCSKCNLEKDITEYSLRRNGQWYPYRLKYCNACRKEQIRDSYYKDIEKFLKYRLTRLRAYCKRKNINCTITLENLLNKWKIQYGKCFYTDTKLKWRYTKRHRYGVSFDRVNYKAGYSNKNVVLCTTKINTVKSDLTLNEIKKWMPEWYSRIKMREEF